MIEFFKNKIFIDEIPLRFFGMQLRTRMTIIRLKNDKLFLHSPTKLDSKLIRKINNLGEVAFIVAPNKLHHLFLDSYVKQYPKAIFYATPGLEKKRKDIHFNENLKDQSHKEWADEIDQMIFKGCAFMEEVFFFHKESKTLIITDFIQSMHSHHNFFERIAGRIGGIYNNPSPPRDLRVMFYLDRKNTRQSIQRVNQWDFDKIIISHGKLITKNAKEVFSNAFQSF
tara:strand:- start:34 stop:711 length:678 start_codon:yes stop_codon:yes gene_type:complete